MEPEDRREGEEPGDFDLTPEEEDELERRFADSLKAEQQGKLLPWEAVFPPPAKAG